MTIPWAFIDGVQPRRLITWLPLIIPLGISIAMGNELQGWFVLAMTLALILSPPKPSKWLTWALVGVSLSVVVIFPFQRPAGIFMNALSAGEALGLLALALRNPWLGFVAGLTGSRAIVGVIGLGFRRRKWWAVTAAAFAAGVLLFTVVHGNRFVPSTVTNDTDRRVTTYESAKNVVSDSGNHGGWLGYGFADIPTRQNPHNVFLSLWAQMGLLSVPVWGTLGWKARKEWRLALPLLPSMMLNDWIVSTPDGVAAVALYWILSSQQKTA